MAWKNTTTDITANTVPLSRQPGISILFCRSGSTTIRQIETEDVEEVRGMTESAAKTLAGTSSDGTTQTQYYAFIDNLMFSINVFSGSKVIWGAARRDESGQWCATKRTITYTTSPSSITGIRKNNAQVWSTTQLNSDGQAITLSSGGTSHVVSYTKTCENMAETGGSVLVRAVATTVTEVKYINSETNANSLVNSNTSNTISPTARTMTMTGGISVTYYPMVGTEKHAVARYVNAQEGWTVTITQIVNTASWV